MNRREFLQTTLAAGVLSPRLLRSAEHATVSPLPKYMRAETTRFELAGPVHNYVAAVIDQWLRVAPLSNPAMLEMFRDRERRPLRLWSRGQASSRANTSPVRCRF